MPENNGVKPPSSSQTSATSGRIRYQPLTRARQALGHSSGGSPSSLSRPASRWTIQKHETKYRVAGIAAALQISM